ncbi:MAG: transaldolase [Terriglobia bacterium]
MSQNPLRELNKLGQSVWLDYIRRRELLSGEMKRLIDEDGVSGVTSNPTIFEKAIGGSNDYDLAIATLVEEGLSGAPLFERLEVEDIQTAADLFRVTYDSTNGQDGFVSIEVAPDLAHDTEATISQARRLWQSVNRPNIMVKIPGTQEGLPAIEQCLGEGININITLLFAQERYEEVANAYVAALERRVREGKPIDRIGSVASFFVSRIDTLVDRLLEAKLGEATAEVERAKIAALEGKVAIANAKAAYEKFKAIFSGARFQVLAAKGARVQRVLWASTSTKNPKYRDVLYAEELIGSDTVDTMPPATVTAFRDHGRIRPSLEEDVAGSHQVLQQLAEVGVSLRAATQQLEDEGVASFTRDFEKLLQALAEKRSAMRTVARA